MLEGVKVPSKEEIKEVRGKKGGKREKRGGKKGGKRQKKVSVYSVFKLFLFESQYKPSIAGF